MDSMLLNALFLGCSANTLLIAGLVWSINFPSKRAWPPEQSTSAHILLVWTLTLFGFGSALFIGIEDWGRLEISPMVRWGIGIGLIVVGNIVVWSGVLQLGFAATSGAEGELRTGGLYRYSRNPQYVADICILVGFGILSASIFVWFVILTGVSALALAPLAEEQWLLERYGDAYQKYLNKTRRFF